MPIPKTVDIEIVGPYRGPRISGASDDMDEVRLTRPYIFDTYEIRINCIPAKRDNLSGRIYVSASIAKRVQAKVREIEAAMERLRTDAHDLPPSIRPLFTVDASELLPDAA